MSWYENKKRYHKERYRKLIESGICVRCTKKPAVEGKRFCPECLEFTRLDRARYYRENRDAIQQRDKEKKARRLADGLCVTCGKPREGTRQECDECAMRRKLSRWRRETKKEAQA